MVLILRPFIIREFDGGSLGIMNLTGDQTMLLEESVNMQTGEPYRAFLQEIRLDAVRIQQVSIVVHVWKCIFANFTLRLPIANVHLHILGLVS